MDAHQIGLPEPAENKSVRERRPLLRTDEKELLPVVASASGPVLVNSKLARKNFILPRLVLRSGRQARRFKVTSRVPQVKGLEPRWKAGGPQHTAVEKRTSWEASEVAGGKPASSSRFLLFPSWILGLVLPGGLCMDLEPRVLPVSAGFLVFLEASCLPLPTSQLSRFISETSHVLSL